MSDFISKKQIVSIREFLENYYNLKCNWRGKLTHKRMLDYLFLKGKSADKGRIGEITKEEKLTGQYIYVKDEIGQVIPYKNPMLDLDKIRLSLMKTNPITLEQIRANYLKEENLMYDEYGIVISIEEYEKRQQLQKELEEEMIQNKILDQEYAYYEKMAKRNRKIKVKR